MGFGDLLFGSPVETTTTMELGQLSPEFEELRQQLLRQSGALSLQLGESLLAGGAGDGVMGAAREAVRAGVEFAGGEVSREIGQAQREAALANLALRNQLSGLLGARGGLGSTAGTGQAAAALGAGQARFAGALEQGQSQLGRIGVAGAQMLPQVGLSLREMADRNRAMLLANPVTQHLFQRQTATGTQRGTQTGGPGLLQMAAGGFGTGLGMNLAPGGG